MITNIALLTKRLSRPNSSRLQRFLLAGLFALFTGAIAAQQPAKRSSGGGNLQFGRSTPCLSPVQRLVIEQQIASNRQFIGFGGAGPVTTNGVKKYAFYPQAGVLWGDIFPVNFVDLDPSTGLLDWNGSDYTYDGHQGIDTDLISFAHQGIGVPVFAALDGTVVATNDGETDQNTVWNNQPANFVVLDHGQGHLTYYFHFKSNSVATSVGQTVKAGQQIGLTASSGISTGPHLHFETHTNGVAVEPFAGPARPGESLWINQPPFQSNLYVRTFVTTTDDLSQWAGPPFDTSRTGTITNGVQSVHFWSIIQNLPINTTYGFRFLRPDNSVAFDSGPRSFGISSFSRWSYWWWRWNVDFNVNGKWNVEFLVNGLVTLVAPLEVVPAGTPPQNRPPLAVAAEFEPSAPTSADAVICRVPGAQRPIDDPDYDLVSYIYEWSVNGTVIRTSTNAARSDMIPAGSVGTGDALVCTVTPWDGALSGPLTQVQNGFGGGPPAPEPLAASSVSTTAGTGAGTFSGDGVLSVLTALNAPTATALGSNGNLYVADTGNSRIRKIDANTGQVSTVAGSGASGFSGDGGPADMAELNRPEGIHIAANGDLLIADTGNNRIRRIDAATGLITTLAGIGTAGFSGDGAPATAAELDTPTAVLMNSAGNILVADAGNHRLRSIASDGTITTIAGTGNATFGGDGGLAALADLNNPRAFTRDSAGTLFVADTGNNRIRKIDPAGLISTVAGSGVAGAAASGQAATSSSLRGPTGISTDGRGRLLIADTGNSQIQIVDTNGILLTIAGTGATGFSGDGGPALLARFKTPGGVTYSTAGDVIVADTGNHRIRRVTLPGPTAANAPASATIELLTGTDLSKFQKPGGGPVPWQPIGTNALEVIPGTGDIVSTQSFHGFRLHAEFMTPTNGQDGNSGIFLQGRYEVQIFNSFGVPGTNLTGNDCGAIWGLTPPVTNACLPPGVWQTYEIEFYPAQWNGTNKVRNARATVVLNGVIVQNNVDIPKPTQLGAVELPTPGPLVLQDHGTSVRFRNILITPFDRPPALQWVTTAGDVTDAGITDRAEGTAVDALGNVFTTGAFAGTARFGTNIVTSQGGTDVYLAKQSPAGDYLWLVTGGGVGTDLAVDVAVDPMGNPIITGGLGAAATFGSTNVPNAGQFDSFVAKYDGAGTLQWVQATGGAETDIGNGLATDRQGSIFVAGVTTFGGRLAAFMLKLAPDGTLQWSVSGAALAADAEALGVVADENGGAYYVGRTGGDAQFGNLSVPNTGSQEAFLTHIDASGSVRWVNRSAGPGAELATSIDRGPDGHLYISGWSAGNAAFGSHQMINQGGFDTFLIKSTPQGSTVWLRQLVGTQIGGPRSVSVDGAGGAYVSAPYVTNTVVGAVGLPARGGNEGLVAKYDTDGTLVWVLPFGGPGNDVIGAVSVSADGVPYLTGFFASAVDFGGHALSSIGAGDLFTARLGSTLDLPPVAQWRFDDLANPAQVTEATGSFPGTLSPTGAVYTADAFSTNALGLLRGTNGFADFGQVPLDAFSPFTLSLLVRTEPGSTNHAIVLSRHDTTTARGFLLGLNGYDTNHHPGSVFFTPTGNFADAAISAPIVNDGRWHSIVVVYDPFRPSLLYVDGQPNGATRPVPMPFDDYRLIAGGALSGGVPFGAFDGWIDELVIYNRKLSAEEIAQQGLYPEETLVKPPVRAEFQWVREVRASGGSTANAVARDAAGNLFVTGKFAGTADFGGVTLFSRGGDDIYVAKYGPDGTLLWAHQAGGILNDAGNDLAIDSVGNVVVAGAISGFGGGGGGGGGGSQIAIFFDGQVFVTRGSQRGFIAKYSPSGSVILVKELWGPATALDTDSNGAIFVGGDLLEQNQVLLHTIELSGRGLSDLWYARFNSVGNALWAYAVGGSGNDRVTGLRMESDGAFYLTGDFTAFIFVNGLFLNPGNAAQAPLLFRVATLDGSVTWARQGSGTPFARPRSLLVDQGGVQIAGQFFNAVTFGSQGLVNSNNFTGFAARHDIFGQPTSAFALGENLSASLRNGPDSLYFTGDFAGTNVIDGVTYQDGGQRDMLIIRRDAVGTNRLVKQITGPAAIQPAEGAGIEADPFGNVYVTGTISWISNAPPVTTRFDSLTITPTNQQTAFLAKMGSELRILRQPADLVATNLDATFLRVLADGEPALSYQWYYNSTNALAGANTARLNLDTITKLLPGTYHVVVSNRLGYAVSAPASVSLELPPIFVNQPTNATAQVNQPGLLYAAVGGNLPLALQWYHNGAPLTDATNASYAIPDTTLANAGAYQLFATNQFGGRASTPVTLTVLQPGELPEITAQPQSRTNSVGSQAVFTVSASGQAPLFYQWYKNGGLLAGRRDATLFLSGVQLADAANYHVVVTNLLGGITSSNATLTVFSPVSVAITVQPVGTNVLIGQSVILSVTATGSPTLRYQWRRDSADIPGATASTLILNNVTALNTGTYTVQISNDTSAKTSAAVAVTVFQAPVFTQQPQSVVVTNGQFTTFQSVVEGIPAPLLNWFKDGLALTNNNGFFGVNTPTLTIPAAGIAHLGTYYLQASNSVGLTLSSPALLGLNFPPRILSQPQPVNLAPGVNHTFSLSVTGAPPIELRWVKDGQPLLSATNASLALTNLTRAHTGVYYLTATNQNGGTVSSNALLRVLVQQRLSATLHTNGTFRFVFGDADGSNLIATNLPLLEVQLSSNLIHWDPATTPLIYTNGQLLYEDSSTPQPNRRYYRVIEP